MLKDDLRITFQAQLEKYPDFLSVKHLVDMGLFTSHQDFYLKKKINSIPPPLDKKARRYKFPKAALIEWLIDKVLDKEDLKK